MEASDLLHVEGIILTTQPIHSTNLMASNDPPIRGSEPQSPLVETVDQSQTASEFVHFTLATQIHSNQNQVHSKPITT